MIGYLVVLYGVAATATATEVALRLRDAWLRQHAEFKVDAEDIAFVVAAGLLWPLTVVAGAWLMFYTWRGRRASGSQGEG